MPSNAPLGLVSVQATVNGVKCNPSPVRVVNSSFGMFTANSAGFGPAIVQNFIAADNQPINSQTAVASPGQVVTLWGTGLGPANGPDNTAPQAGDLPTAIEIFVGGQSVASADKLYSGRTPCCSGIDQVVFRIPANAPLGCYIPILVRTDGVVTSNAGTIAISPAGAPCSDPANPFSAANSKGKTATALLSRLLYSQTTDVTSPLVLNTDTAYATFREEAGGPFFFNPFFSLPPLGACTVYAGAGNNFLDQDLPAIRPSVRSLDAGSSITVRNSAGASAAVTSPNAQSKDYFGLLGAFFTTLSNLTPMFLDPGAYSVSGPGGADVGSFQTRIGVAAPLTTNLSKLSVVNRAQPLTVTWSAPDVLTTAIAILGANYDTPSDSTGMFLCLASPSAGTFSVPPWILANVPQSRPRKYQSRGILILGALRVDPSSAFTASGLDAGVAASLAAVGNSVLFQ